MKIWDALQIGLQVIALREAIKERPVGAEVSLPAIKVKIGREKWLVGETPARRLE